MNMGPTDNAVSVERLLAILSVALGWSSIFANATVKYFSDNLLGCAPGWWLFMGTKDIKTVEWLSQDANGAIALLQRRTDNMIKEIKTLTPMGRAIVKNELHNAAHGDPTALARFAEHYYGILGVKTLTDAIEKMEKPDYAAKNDKLIEGLMESLLGQMGMPKGGFTGGTDNVKGPGPVHEMRSHIKRVDSLPDFLNSYNSDDDDDQFPSTRWNG